jgi:hypothetical protein
MRGPSVRHSPATRQPVGAGASCGTRPSDMPLLHRSTERPFWTVVRTRCNVRAAEPPGNSRSRNRCGDVNTGGTAAPSSPLPEAVPRRRRR